MMQPAKQQDVREAQAKATEQAGVVPEEQLTRGKLNAAVTTAHDRLASIAEEWRFMGGDPSGRATTEMLEFGKQFMKAYPGELGPAAWEEATQRLQREWAGTPAPSSTMDKAKKVALGSLQVAMPMVPWLAMPSWGSTAETKAGSPTIFSEINQQLGVTSGAYSNFEKNNITAKAIERADKVYGLTGDPKVKEASDAMKALVHRADYNAAAAANPPENPLDAGVIYDRVKKDAEKFRGVADLFQKGKPEDALGAMIPLIGEWGAPEYLMPQQTPPQQRPMYGPTLTPDIYQGVMGATTQPTGDIDIPNFPTNLGAVGGGY